MPEQTDIELDLVRKIAHSFHRTTGLDWEDLFQEACLYYLTAVDDPNFDPNRMKFTSFAWMRMRTLLCDYVRKQAKGSCDQSIEDLVEEGDPDDILPSSHPLPGEVFRFLEEVEGLSPEGREICRLVAANPSDYTDQAPKKARGRIRDQLRESGWTWSRIWSGFREVKGMVSSGP